MGKNTKKQRVFIAMSGGVDSSVAALLLKKRGYDVIGVFMRCWGEDNGSSAGLGINCAERDAEDARRVAEKLKIPFYVWDFEKEYKKKVVDYMIDGYRRGITPNPDVMCNKEIKFGLFLKKALEMGADYVATGHYVKIQNDKSKSKIVYNLFQAKDLNKDQSYFLWTLTQGQLRHCLFPIGDYLKSEVREMARKAGLPTAEKKDSQGICFLGKVTLDEFLEKYLPKKKGEVLDVRGGTLGEHKGAHFYTIGQRHIGANFQFPARLRQKTRSLAGEPISNFQKNRRPYYIAQKDIKANVLVVAEGSDNPALYKKEIELQNVNFINSSMLPSLIRANGRIGKIDVLVRVRYRQPLAPATLIYADARKQNPRKSASKNSKSARVRVIFEQAQKFVAPGQSAVFYEYKEHPLASSRLKMFGGGIIV